MAIEQCFKIQKLARFKTQDRESTSVANLITVTIKYEKLNFMQELRGRVKLETCSGESRELRPPEEF